MSVLAAKVIVSGLTTTSGRNDDGGGGGDDDDEISWEASNGASTTTAAVSLASRGGATGVISISTGAAESLGMSDVPAVPALAVGSDARWLPDREVVRDVLFLERRGMEEEVEDAEVEEEED